MTQNYDNWERIVRAVLQREHDIEIALMDDPDHSFSSTSSTFDHSFCFKSQFDPDYDNHPLFIDDSDLTLDYNEWKTMLPPDKQEVVLKSASLSFSVDQRTRKNCFLLGATKLITSPADECGNAFDMKSHPIMPGGDEYGNSFEMKSHPKSRFLVVAELVESPTLNIRGSIRTKMLSPETFYATYLVFECNETNMAHHKAYSIMTVRSVVNKQHHLKPRAEPNNYFKQLHRVVHLEASNGRADGWKEIILGAFYVGLGDIREVQVQLYRGGYEIRGIIVEGIEFRPLE